MKAIDAVRTMFAKAGIGKRFRLRVTALSTILAAFVCPAGVQAQAPVDVDAYGTVWKPLRIGAGGWLTGIDIASDGTKVVRTDTYGGMSLDWFAMDSARDVDIHAGKRCRYRKERRRL